MRFFLLFCAACNEYKIHPDPGPVEGEDSPAPEDCALSADAYAVDADAACVVEAEPGGFSPVVEWQWAANPTVPGYEQIMATPAVGNVTDDNGDGRVDDADVPDVVFASFAGSAYTTAGTLTAISGDGSGTHWSVYDPGGFHLYSSGGVAIGDLDGNGTPEVCAAGVEAAVVCLTGKGELKWAGGTETYGYGAPALADLDGDGQSEVVFGRQVLDTDGTLLATGAYGAGRYLSYALDIDGDGVQEIHAGSSLYNADMSLRWDDGTADGPGAAADFDGDGAPELVHVGSGSVIRTGADGVVRWTVTIPGGGTGGAPTIADFDGDGAPEVGVAGAYKYAVIETDGSTLWTSDVQDASSNVTGSAVFDFEGDGRADVVYADELDLRVYDGATGEVKLTEDNHASGTLYEYPLIADVDADGATEIILASNNYAYSGWTGITVIGDASGTWRPSRPVWNQYAYSVSNVDDDGGIPASPTPSWTVWNSFRAAAPAAGASSDLPDLGVDAPEVCTLDCDADEVSLLLPVYNSGLVPADTTAAIVHDGDVLWSQAVSLGSGEGAWLGPIAFSRGEWKGSLRATLDADGLVEECDETDNSLDLGAWPCP